MRAIGTRELGRALSEVLDALERTGEPAIVVRNGRVAAVLSPVDEARWTRFVLRQSPEFARTLEQANHGLQAGARIGADEALREAKRQSRGQGGRPQLPPATAVKPDDAFPPRRQPRRAKP